MFQSSQGRLKLLAQITVRVLRLLESLGGQGPGIPGRFVNVASLPVSVDRLPQVCQLLNSSSYSSPSNKQFAAPGQKYIELVGAYSHHCRVVFDWQRLHWDR